jgi:hypothetical protein
VARKKRFRFSAAVPSKWWTLPLVSWMVFDVAVHGNDVLGVDHETVDLDELGLHDPLFARTASPVAETSV